MASSAVGKSRIYGYAREPHVISLIEYLRSVVGDSGFEEIDLGGRYNQNIKVIYGNREYDIRISESEIGEDDD
jgi:hypothetical protein